MCLRESFRNSCFWCSGKCRRTARPFAFRFLVVLSSLVRSIRFLTGTSRKPTLRLLTISFACAARSSIVHRGQSLMIDLDCNSESGKTHVGSYRGATNGQGMQTLDRRTEILILTKANEFSPLFMGMDPISRSYGFLQDLSPTQSLPLSPEEIAQRWSAICQSWLLRK